MSRWAKWLSFGWLTATLVVTLHHLRHLYLARYFGYHDVALINDLLASLFRQGRVFHVFDLGINHLAWHFTPSLFLVTPLYAVFDSQFLLLVWSTLAAFGGYAALLALADRLLKRVQANPTERALAGLTLASLMGLGLFPWRVAMSGHFEHLFILGSSLMLLALVREAALGWVLAPFLLALGTREDTGIFLAAQLIGLMFLPSGFVVDRARLRRRAGALALVSLAWTAAVVKLVFPAFGLDENWRAQHHWGQLGSTFGEVAWRLLAHPALFVHAVSASAFVELNRTLLFLPWLNPPLALAVNAPGALFYTMAAPDRVDLLYYNSAMLLPGLFLGCAVGLALLRRWLAPRRFALPVLAVFFLLSVFTSRFLDRLRDENLAYPQEYRAQLEFAADALRSCPEVQSVASDFRTSVFLPNHVKKYLLWNYGRADAVLYASNGARFTPGPPPESAQAPDFPDSAQGLAALAHDREYHLVGQSSGLLFLVRSGLACRELPMEESEPPPPRPPLNRSDKS